MIKFEAREKPASCRIWGVDHEETALKQLEDACWLPVTVGAAGMSDLHLGYGLPIGGVLATRNAVVPYAVGMDIACRMRMTLLDIDPLYLPKRVLTSVIESCTSFGLGACFFPSKDHEVMNDAAWDMIPFLRENRDLAWSQLGTSGSGNHFVEFGTFTTTGFGTLPGGVYTALLSHSGSRGIGAKACQYYSKLAENSMDDMPQSLKKLSWFDMAGAEGQEYWTVMELMGEYARANHLLIHHDIIHKLDCHTIFTVENHHNFAWKEKWNGEEVIVHRKGATPAAEGVLGVIPGSMGTPGYLVRGKGVAESFNSASHGAGRAMSRKATKKNYTWKDAQPLLEAAGVTVISAGNDEIPQGYKDIHKVMAAQADLVEVLGEFNPKLVKMSGDGERED